MSDLKSLLQEKIKENRPKLSTITIFIYLIKSCEIMTELLIIVSVFNVYFQEIKLIFCSVFIQFHNLKIDIENRDDNKKFSHNFTGFYKIDDEDSDSD